MRVFLTGATGFIGRGLTERLCGDAEEIRCLARDPARLPVHRRIRPVAGALDDDSSSGRASLEAALRGCDVVVHLAGQTGHARPDVHRRVNAGGTARLLTACRAAGVPRFVHVSTIAVTYPEKRHYPYARAKEEAERAVRESGLDWAIVRPTVVCGPGSPVAARLSSLAVAPVLPLLGGGRSRVQPVHVDDVVACLATLAAEPALDGRTLEVGGRDVVTFAEFLGAMRMAQAGRRGPRVSVPLFPLVEILGVLESVLPVALPVSAGQFYAFRHDGVARDDPRAEPPRAARKGVPEIVEEIRAASVPDDELDEECSVFVRHLAGVDANETLRLHYRRAHEAGRHGPVEPDAATDPLVAFARRSPQRAFLADVWASRFDSAGPLRRKLALLTAMLESTGDTVARVDRPTSSPLVFVATVAVRVAMFALALPVAAVVFGRRAFGARDGDAK